MALSEHSDIALKTAERSPRSGQPNPDRAQVLGDVAEMRAIEAADRAAEDPDAVLQQVETVDKTARLQELAGWAERNLPDLKPHELTAKALHQIERDEGGFKCEVQRSECFEKPG